jgi:phage shock protein C
MGSTNVFSRPDTMLGVCQAIGEDFGFHPNWLRVAFAVPLIVSPFAVIGAYLALGLVVLATRMLLPNPRVAAEAVPVEAGAEPVSTGREARERAEELALAA